MASRNSTWKPLIYIQCCIQMSWAGENVHTVGCLIFPSCVQVQGLTQMVSISNGSFWDVPGDFRSGRVMEGHERSCSHNPETKHFCVCCWGQWDRTTRRHWLEDPWSCGGPQSTPWCSSMPPPQQHWGHWRTRLVPQTPVPSWWSSSRSPGWPPTHVSGLKSSGWAHVWGLAGLPALCWARVDKGGQPNQWEAEPGSLAPTPLSATSERDLQRPQDEALRLSPLQKY